MELGKSGADAAHWKVLELVADHLHCRHTGTNAADPTDEHMAVPVLLLHTLLLYSLRWLTLVLS